MIKIIKKIDFDGREKIKAHLLERGRKKKKASRKKKEEEEEEEEEADHFRPSDEQIPIRWQTDGLIDGLLE
jgi:hypothetical protein